MFKSDHILDLVELSTDPRIVLVAMGVKFGESSKSLLRLAVVNEPTA